MKVTIEMDIPASDFAQAQEGLQKVFGALARHAGNLRLVAAEVVPAEGMPYVRLADVLDSRQMRALSAFGVVSDNAALAQIAQVPHNLLLRRKDVGEKTVRAINGALVWSLLRD